MVYQLCVSPKRTSTATECFDDLSFEIDCWSFLGIRGSCHTGKDRVPAVDRRSQTLPYHSKWIIINNRSIVASSSSKRSASRRNDTWSTLVFGFPDPISHSSFIEFCRLMVVNNVTARLLKRCKILRGHIARTSFSPSTATFNLQPSSNLQSAPSLSSMVFQLLLSCRWGHQLQQALRCDRRHWHESIILRDVPEP